MSWFGLLWHVLSCKSQTREFERDNKEFEGDKVIKLGQFPILFIFLLLLFWNFIRFLGLEDFWEWQHLQGLPKSARHVRKLCTWLISLLLIARSTTRLASDVTTVRLKVITIKIESFEHRDTWGTLLWHWILMVFIVLFGFFYLILYVCTHAILCFVTSVLGYGSSYIWVLFEDYDHEDMNLYGVLGNILLC